ncbi:hypothetical protein OEZ85_010473 [Tetradesmus obliquus]|uniref:C3H1-type domain-containing protein n=1 Tax=Tetradesmus obliquus TaxID=3088 RepID=A0ABY8TS45_TETOB|nr:hypothetical protein OEZ85_010473 [Tetradesmus obliquus]
MQVGLPMLMLVRDVVVQLHREEDDADAVILVFLPTYKTLELLHRLLLELAQQNTAEGDHAASLQLFPLHSSVDIDEAMASMQQAVAPGSRKVILATNVAESSVTIPHVKHVIDACTTNQVYWDAASCRERAQVVWASQSAAEQRAGRTGRTCAGTCYRLMPRAAFLKLDRFDCSSLTLRSLRREVLSLLSAASRAMADPAALLAQALDAPQAAVVAAALEYLQQVGLAAPNAKGRLEPSRTGAFIAALPLSLESSLLLACGGLAGHAWEACLLAALMNATPYPIQQPFGSAAMKYVTLYYYGPDSQGAAGGAAAAVEAGLMQPDSAAAAAGVFGYDDTLTIIVSALHTFRPSFIHRAPGPPEYYRRQQASHTCRLLPAQPGSVLEGACSCQGLAMPSMHSYSKHSQLLQLLGQVFQAGTAAADAQLLQLQDSSSSSSSSNAWHSNGASAGRGIVSEFGLKEVDVDADGDQEEAYLSAAEQQQEAADDATPVCKFFISSSGCRFGSQCNFRHAQPTCRFFLSRSGCMYAQPDQPAASLGCGIIATSYEQRQGLGRIYPGRALEARLQLLEAAGVELRYGVDATQLYQGLEGITMSSVQHLVWNFPLAVSAEAAAASAGLSAAQAAKLLGADDEANMQLMGRFLAGVAGQMAAWQPNMKLHIALCLDQYGRWGMDGLARSCFLFLQQSRQIHLADWPGYTPRRGLLDGAFPTDRAVVYTFGLALPSGHIPSTPKLQQALRILEMRQLLQHARSKAGAAAAAEQSQAAAAANEQSQAAAIAKSTLASVDALCALVEANTAVAGAGPLTFGGSHDVVFTPGKRTVATRRSARLAKNN